MEGGVRGAPCETLIHSPRTGTSDSLDSYIHGGESKCAILSTRLSRKSTG
jgi:hypothetical protein